MVVSKRKRPPRLEQHIGDIGMKRVHKFNWVKDREWKVRHRNPKSASAQIRNLFASSVWCNHYVLHLYVLLKSLIPTRDLGGSLFVQYQDSNVVLHAVFSAWRSSNKGTNLGAPHFAHTTSPQGGRRSTLHNIQSDHPQGESFTRVMLFHTSCYI